MAERNKDEELKGLDRKTIEDGSSDEINDE
jgi:hypothetical protein